MLVNPHDKYPIHSDNENMPGLCMYSPEKTNYSERLESYCVNNPNYMFSYHTWNLISGPLSPPRRNLSMGKFDWAQEHA